MAQFEKWFTQDLTQNIELRHCESIVFTNDNLSNVVGVNLFVSGVEYSGGGTVTASVVRSDGATVALAGTLDGNKASVTLTSGCFGVPGLIGVYIRLNDGDTKTTVLSAVFTVIQSETGSAVDPGTIIPSVQVLIDEIEDAVNSIPADYSQLLASIAPTFSTSTAYAAGVYVWQEGVLYRFTAAHPAGSWTGTDATAVVVGNELSNAVRYDIAQTLEPAQKAQARDNIRAADAADFDAVAYPLGVVMLNNLGEAVRVIAGGISTAGADLNRTDRARTQYFSIQPGHRYMFSLDNAEFVVISAWEYTGSTQASVIGRVTESGYTVSRFAFTASGNFARIAFAHADNTVTMTDDDRAQILAALSLKESPVDGNFAPVDTTTATATHAAGSLLTVNGQLYETTQAISAGVTIIPGTNVTPTTVAAQLAERDTAIAAETAARETAIAGLPMSTGAFFSEQLGANGSLTINGKAVTVIGNHVEMHGTGASGSSTFAMFNVLGTLGGVNNAYSEARVKSLFTSGYCYTADGLIFPPNRTGLLRVASVKRSAVTPPNAWEFGIGLYTYNATTDTLTAGYHGYTYSDFMNGSANCPLAFEVSLSAEFIEAVRTNNNLALVVYGKTGAQYASSSLDLYWEIVPVALTT